jgi:large subunit ribosomal protein L3
MSSLNDKVGLVGEKAGMTQVFDENGQAQVVTVLELLPLVVTQIKTVEQDGYTAVQVGYKDAKAKHLSRPEQGVFKKNNIELKRHLQEFRMTPEVAAQYSIGQEVDIVSLYSVGEAIKVSGKSIGKGFQGTVRAHGFGRGPMSHGSKSHRLPGSIGAGTTPGRVTRGQKMAKRVGNKVVTTLNLKVINVLNVQDKTVMLVSGAVPGKPGALLTVTAFKRVGQK